MPHLEFGCAAADEVEEKYGKIRSIQAPRPSNVSQADDPPGALPEYRLIGVSKPAAQMMAASAVLSSINCHQWLKWNICSQVWG